MTFTAFPEAELFLPESGEPALRWGLIGPGWIAGEFVDAVHEHTAQRFVAVASRSLDRATAFASEHGIESAFGSAAKMLARPDVDVVYIASPPGAHLAEGLAALAAGKHVIIEKPLASSAVEAQLLADAARAAGVLLMEAMWTRYLPQTSVIRALLADGALGEVRAVVADHGQAINPGPEHRLSRVDLGGGALLDLGIYPLQFDSMVLGAPTRVTAIGGLTDTGVDEYASLILNHDGHAQSTLTTSMVTRTPNSAVVAGSEAHLFVAPTFYNPTSLSVTGNDHFATPMHWDDPTSLRGFAALSWEATALARFVGEGSTESPLHTLDETVSILATIDEARTQLELQAIGSRAGQGIGSGA
ncbi:oxidoreductase [Frondihabitans sp. PAMC 28766]|uniref:Gfo/Idh/MocA family protein n=1 Tax=Frondihabitans sp. PAMC 28766 TaxID=1795630 RepID=UPI00078D5FC9|nr:Gfo/Idh/MocA family oxidoreductase [Frondihabitans sp. PAMC 28766]AMM19403.1 oxidoreductase [Frondihabitans sp. PAMC 28766]